MLNLLFWNLNNKPLADAVALLAHEHDLSIIVLAEAGDRIFVPRFRAVASQCDRLKILVRFHPDLMKAKMETDRFSISSLAPPGSDNILVAAAHLPSKLHRTEADQTTSCRDLANAIREVEDTEGHQRTIVIGDLNANPFEPGLAQASALNAVMARNVATGKGRSVQNRRYPYFYNPMWGHLGDRFETPGGTYFYDKGGELSYHWHTFDQVLLRPEIAERFQEGDLEIVHAIGGQSLLNDRGRPDASRFSDHLPIFFRIRL
ncbi:MAG: hypothetical protein NTZ56_13105 [Acidobacteria bacterium]|nr:hypothetical protein [Acidobacteriota bacterium]